MRTSVPLATILRAAALAAGTLASLGSLLAGCTGGSADTVERALAEGRTSDAWRLSGELLRADSASVPAWIDRAAAALATGRTRPGLAAAARAISLSGGTEPLPYLLHAYLDQQRYRNIAAVHRADTARALAPDDLRSVRAAGELRFGGGMVGSPDYTGAEEAFRAAIAIDSTDVRTRLGLGQALVLGGKTEEGEAWIEGVLAEYSAWGEAHYLAGVARMRHRDFEAALARFEAAASFDPAHAGAWFNRARVMDRLGRHDEAGRARERSEMLRVLAKEVQRTGEVWFASGEMLAGVAYARRLRLQGRWEEARRVAHVLVEESPNVLAPWMELAEAAAAVGRAAEAREAAERAIALDARQSRAFLLVARAAEEEGDLAVALEHARRAAALDPADAESSALLAHLLVVAGDADGAFAPLDEAFRRGTRDLRVAAARAEAQIAAGRSGEASGLLDRLLQTSLRAEWLVLRARAREAAGRSRLAIEDLQLALDLEPRHLDAWRGLADLLEGSRKREEAETCRDRVAEIEREDEAARVALAAWESAPRDPETAKRAVERLTAAGRTADAGRVTRWTHGFGVRP